LVPLGPPLLAYRSKSKAMLTAVDGAVELVVDRPYKAGDSIVVWYDISSLRSCTFLCCFGMFFKKIEVCIICRCGPQPNSKLLLNYGFVDEVNSYDRLVVKVKFGYLLFVVSILPFNSVDILYMMYAPGCFEY
jgi:hypothetical protein